MSSEPVWHTHGGPYVDWKSPGYLFPIELKIAPVVQSVDSSPFPSHLFKGSELKTLEPLQGVGLNGMGVIER